MNSSQNTTDIVNFLNESIKNGTLVARIEGNTIILNNGETKHVGVDITLNNEHAGGTWHVNDWH